jgi:hypothetical protein
MNTFLSILYLLTIYLLQEHKLNLRNYFEQKNNYEKIYIRSRP